MGLLNIAGGAAQGYVRGDQDIQRRREFEAMQKQRKRVEDQQAIDDQLAAQARAVRPAGTYEDMVPQGHEAATDFVGPVGPQSGAKKVKTVRKPSDVAREQAGVIGRGGRLQDISAQAALNAQAYQADAADRAERDAQKREALTNIGQAIATGNTYGAARLISEGYKKHVPDGHELIIESKNGVPHWAVAGPDGKFIEPLQPITPQSVKQRYDQGVAMLTPELSMQDRKLGIEQYGAESGRISAEAAMQNARSTYQKVLFETGDQAEAERQAHIAYYDRLGRAALMRAGTEASNASANRFGPPLAFSDDQGNTQFGAWTTKGDKPAFTPVTGPPANWTQKGDKNLSASQTKAWDMYRDIKKGEGFKSAFDEESFLKMHGIHPDQSGGTFGKIAAGGQQGPPEPTAEQKAKATPNTPEAAAEQKVSEAEKALSKFGSRQRKENPAGYAAAVKRRTAAQAELDALTAKYAATQPTGPAVITQRP